MKLNHMTTCIQRLKEFIHEAKYRPNAGYKMMDQDGQVISDYRGAVLTSIKRCFFR